jgi:hypothetical protein
MRVLDGVEVDDLVAHLAAVVVVEVGASVWEMRSGLVNRAPVDQVGGIADAVGSEAERSVDASSRAARAARRAC